jgi:DNA end-binding protein Ku
MAASWKGSISFGLVNIPIQLHNAVADSRPHFRLLHAKDKSPVSYERVCQREGKAVDWKDIVKGFEYAKGKFAVLTKEDFDRAAVEKTKTIDVLDFVRGQEIDDRFFDSPYYVVPQKGGERSYAVLREAIRKSDRIGICKFVMRETQHLAALTVVENALVLTTMRFADDLADVDKFTFPSAKDVRPKEVEMGTMLVKSLAADWKPEKYTDEYRVNLERVIKAKIKGREPKLEVEEPKHSAQVVDLMERLRQSLEARGASRGKPRGKKTKARRAA